MALIESLIAAVNRDIIRGPELEGGEVPCVADLVTQSDAIADTESPLGNTLRVSSLVTMCPRQMILLHRMIDRPARRHSSATRVAFGIGHGIHNHVAEQVIKAREGHGVWGDWRCRCGHSGRLGFKPVNLLPCDRCRGELSNYNEPYLLDLEHRIGGHPDLILGANGTLYVVEVKSMAASQFDGLESPVYEHRLQALMYRELMVRLGYEMADEVIIFYVRKQWHYRDSPYKEFTSDATGGLNRLAVASCYDVARQIWQAITDGGTPERVVCNSASSPIARECPVAIRCFST